MQGGDCFGAFMQWGLPKGTLKDVWAAVAGDQGYLSQQQFVQCLYLMDNAKRVSLTTLPAARLLVASFACGKMNRLSCHSINQSIKQSINQSIAPGLSLVRAVNRQRVGIQQTLSIKRSKVAHNTAPRVFSSDGVMESALSHP
jgi:hypothetical protein